jgi:uncharacterized protein (TIGR02145 family)
MQISISKLIKLLFQIFLISGLVLSQTVTDFDGNVYNTVTIGSQTWIKENLKSLHYFDGSEIPDVIAYNNLDSLAGIYGLLYTWDAAMNGSTEPGTQGVCPCEWHVPTDEEWTILENYLGGSSVAGGKMKEIGIEHWYLPNTGATNSSGFSGLPAGEYDGYYSPHIFQLLGTHAVFWTSTQINQTKARERYLSYDNAASSVYDWFKVMKYSIRCIKDTVTVDIENERELIEHFDLLQNYPNPFNPTTNIHFNIPQLSFVTLKVYDVLGNEIKTVVNEVKTAGNYEIEFDGTEIPSGVYLYQIRAGSFNETKKMILMK